MKTFVERVSDLEDDKLYGMSSPSGAKVFEILVSGKELKEDALSLKEEGEDHVLNDLAEMMDKGEIVIFEAKFL